MDVKDIQSLIKFIAKSGASEVKLELKDIKITVKTGTHGTSSEVVFPSHQVSMPMSLPTQPIPVQQPPVPTPSQSDAPKKESSEAEQESKYVQIKSPMIGTFYRKPSPDEDPFVEVGATVKKGDTICVIEAMKLFNEIETELSGKIVKVLVDDMSPVEFDQPLFLIDPS